MFLQHKTPLHLSSLFIRVSGGALVPGANCKRPRQQEEYIKRNMRE
jgi:hypothetical protein